MPLKFNPFTAQFDLTGSGGGGASYIDGEVATYADLPLDGTAPLNTAWLVRTASGVWPVSRKQAGIYIRTATGGSSRDADYTYAGTMPDVFSDAVLTIYDEASTTRTGQFNLGSVTAGQNRVLTWPDASGTLGWLQSVSSITVSSTHQLTAARNQRVLVNSTNATSGSVIYLPSTGTAEGDRLEVACVGLTSGTLSVRTGQYDFTVSTSMGLNEQRTFIYSAGAWTLGSVESHTHTGLGPTFGSSAFRVTEPSGIATNVLAFSLSSITAGATRTLTVPNLSGTIALNETFAAPPAIGNTTANSGTFTTLNATGTTELVNGVSAAGPFLMYRSYTNVSNYERGFVRWDSSVLRMGTERLGGSGNLDFELTRMGAAWVRLLNNGLNIDTVLTLNNSMFAVLKGGYIEMATSTGAAPLQIHRDAADTLAQRIGTPAQTFRLYGTYTAATNYQRMTVRSVKQTLSALSGASATTTGTFIPDGAVVVGVTTRVATLLTGAAGYTIGDGTDADRWGDITGTAVGTTSDNRDWTAGTIECFTAGGEITLTAKTSDFTAGAIEICAFYLAGEAD